MNRFIVMFRALLQNPRMDLWRALIASGVAITSSAIATQHALSTNIYSLGAYFTVTIAVPIVAWRFCLALAKKAEAEAAPALVATARDTWRA